MNYYNENDPKAAQWLRQLAAAGLIPAGHVDERSIHDVTGSDLAGFTQCHFFAGIGGWSLALRLAGWPDDQPVWTGSCPCQPFSVAGKGLGRKDPRHLWPEFHRLIRECAPPVVFGEQVASKAGRGWLARVCADLEALAYATGAADLCAAGVGAPHIRQRLFWMAHATGERRDGGTGVQRENGRAFAEATGGLCEPNGTGREPGRLATKATGHGGAAEPAGGSGGVGDSNGAGCSQHGGPVAVQEERDSIELRGNFGGVVHSSLPEKARLRSLSEQLPGQAAFGMGHSEDQHEQRFGESREVGSGAVGGSGFWSDFDLLPCRDGKVRRVESSSFPLADGFPGRVGLLRGYGNAIVSQVAAEFIQAFQDIRPGTTTFNP